MGAHGRPWWVLSLALGCGGSGTTGGTQEIILQLREGAWEGEYLGPPVITGTILGLPVGIGPHYRLRAVLSRTSDDLVEGTLWAYDPVLTDPADVGRIAISVVSDPGGGEHVRVSIYLPKLHVSETYDWVSASDVNLRAESDVSSVQLGFDAA